nr:hypothetical protein [Tanacetum cinerariifolium]
LVEKLKSEIADFKNKNKSLIEANNKLFEVNAHLYADYKKSKAKLQRLNTIKYATEMKLECAKVRDLKEKLFAHQDTISTLKQQKDAQIKLYKTQEDKDIEKVIDLENKVKVLDNIVYKTGQSVQTMNMLNNKCRTSFAKPEYLKKVKQAHPRLYNIGCYNNNLALMLSPKSDEVIQLEKESRSKLSDLVRPFDYAKLNNLYDLFVPQREKSYEQRFVSELSRIRNKKCQSSFEIENIQRDINTIVTGVELCKQKIANPTYYGHIEPVIKNTIEKKFCPVISRINVGLFRFIKRLNEEMVADLRYFNSLESEVDSLTSQLETQKTQFKEAQIKLYKTREDKELDKVTELEQKVKVLDNIVYKTGQSVQTMNMLNNKCQTSFAKPEFLKKAQRANPRLYDIGFYNDNLALMLAPDSEEVIRLEKESRSKLNDLIRHFDYDKLNNLYDLFVSQREKSSE